MTSAAAAGTAVALTATLGLAAVSRVVAVRQMSGMDMGAVALAIVGLGSPDRHRALSVPGLAPPM